MPVTKFHFTDTTLQRLYFYSLLFFAVLIPFQFKPLPLTLGLMVYSLVWVLSTNFGHKFKLLAEVKLAGLFFLYALWIVIGAIYSPVPGDAEKYLTLKIPFAAWPILMGSVALFSLRDKERLLQAFVFAVLAAILVSFGESLWDFFRTGDDSHLYFSELIHFDRVPPHYFGMYVNFVYGIVLYRLLNGRYLANRKYLSIISLLLFFISLVFISVRMQYAVFLAINLVVLFSFRNTINLRTKLIWSAGSLISLLLLAYLLPGSRQRLVDTVNEAISFERMVNDKQTNPRKFLWQEGWKVAQDNFWVGTGTGAENDALQVYIQDVEAKFWDGSQNFFLRDRGYNYHNAYLQHWAGHGIIGLTILLAMFIVPFFTKDAPVEAKIFLLVCALSFLTESMLQRQAGVLFFSFFYSLFFFLKPVKQ